MTIIDTNYEFCKGCLTGGCCDKFDRFNPPVISEAELAEIKRIYGDDVAKFHRIGWPSDMMKAAESYFKPRIKDRTDRKLYEALLEGLRGKFYYPAIKEKKTCSLLTGKGCAIYDNRPLDCKLFPFTILVKTGNYLPGIWLAFDASLCGRGLSSEWTQNFISRYSAQALAMARQYDPSALIEYSTININLPHKDDVKRLIKVAPIYQK